MSNKNMIYEVETLKPTQCAVGMDHVNRKVSEMKSLKQQADGKRKVSEFIKSHPAPVVTRNQDVYLIDNHHMCRALVELGDDFFKDIPIYEDDISKSPNGKSTPDKPVVMVKVVSDLSDIESQDEFWKVMDEKKWVHPYDKNGNRVAFSEIPNTISKLQDDIFRSIAAIVKIQGGFKKTFIPYAEFQWANYFRSCWKDHHKMEKEHFDIIIDKSMKLAKHKDAENLPGYNN
ncbi:hypothetical protein CYY_001208 [Polysphondylium violaceum]|uniref:ParB/Sulfiredoxin domain-containing protein n=1 Tax=Polysphondylium violaceum TaxID=133409 RepID=A0A8J4Q2A9_9MYCE|nr:hypothetical protein CYY_001208 [Polysphondylium violaceum]